MEETPQPIGFKAWVWDPDASSRPRGFPTAQLWIYLHELRVVPNRIGAKLKAAPPEIRYAWPAVVIEHHKPVPQQGILCEVNGKLGRVVVLGGSRGRLRRALERAEFEVIEVSHLGWEAPHKATRAELGAAADRVPTCVVGQ